MMPTRPEVRGREVDAQTRCAHWHGETDVIAIRMFCCGEYYACRDCHAGQAGHALLPWPQSRWSDPAVLCGVCGSELSVSEYLGCGARCPRCAAEFNPRCALHYADYFEV